MQVEPPGGVKEAPLALGFSVCLVLCGSGRLRGSLEALGRVGIPNCCRLRLDDRFLHHSLAFGTLLRGHHSRGYRIGFGRGAGRFGLNGCFISSRVFNRHRHGCCR
jgi:hypothetical protein